MRYWRKPLLTVCTSYGKTFRLFHFYYIPIVIFFITIHMVLNKGSCSWQKTPSNAKKVSDTLYNKLQLYHSMHCFYWINELLYPASPLRKLMERGQQKSTKGLKWQWIIHYVSLSLYVLDRCGEEQGDLMSGRLKQVKGVLSKRVRFPDKNKLWKWTSHIGSGS